MIATSISAGRLARITSILAATLFWMTVAASAADNNLIVNGDFNSAGGGVPTGWSIHTLPGCGFRFEVHQRSGTPGEFELINEEPVESALQQSVTLKPGWYLFTAEIKTESLGTAGSPPQLFARSATLPIQTMAHPLGWTDDWKTLHLTFRAGTKVPEVVVGFGLGNWGRPNTGRLLIRNPTLVSTGAPSSVIGSADLDVEENPDLEKIAETKFAQLYALREEKTIVPSNRLSARWTVVAVYSALVVIAFIGWLLISPKRIIPRMN